MSSGKLNVKWFDPEQFKWTESIDWGGLLNASTGDLIFAPEKSDNHKLTVHFYARMEWINEEYPIKFALIYQPEDNGHLDQEPYYWGTCIYEINEGQIEGKGEWYPGAKSYQDVIDNKHKCEYEQPWSLDCYDYERGTEFVKRKKRARDFRSNVFALHGACCVITGEKQPAALDAAHIVEVRQEDNTSNVDFPENGIVLRTDLHKLFDARLFWISPENGKILTSNNLSESYKIELQSKHIPKPTLNIIKKQLEQRTDKDNHQDAQIE